MNQLTLCLVLSFFTFVGTARADIQPFSLNGWPAEFAEEATADPATDPFSDLEVLYAQGSVPKLESLVGWFAGRCFLKNEKRAGNSLFVGWKEAVGNDQGPLFPPKEVVKGIWLINGHKEANYFDELTKENEADVMTLWKTVKANVSPSLVEDGAVSMPNPNESGVKYQVRKSGEYLIMHLIEKDKSEAYCYSFKKIK